MPKFAGFTPQQNLVLLQKMGYTGSEQADEMDQFIASSPEVQARLGKFAEAAQARLSKMGYEEGGMVTPNYQQDLDAAQAAFAQAQSEAAADPENEEAQTSLQNAQNALSAAQNAFSQTQIPSSAEATQQAMDNPTGMVTPANVAQIVEDQGQIIQPGTGQVSGSQTASTTTVDQTQQATAPTKTEAASVDPSLVENKVNQSLDGLEAAKADPSQQATVKGQLELLMQDFEGGETPPWASGAMREAMSIMQKRGLGASSMAGAAVVQSAMESAISIASQDAKTYAAFEMQNLSNEQATSIYKSQQRIASMMSDQAQENAAKQFNAASENQVNQFFADLESTVSRFNAEQVNSIRRFNAGETNAIEQFNTQLEAAREQFNAQNDLIIAQANTQWRQSITSQNTAAQNEANMEFARSANGLTQRSLDHIWQKERDLMAFAFAASESAEDRNLQLLLANKNIDAQADSSKKSALGYLAGRLLFG